MSDPVVMPAVLGADRRRGHGPLAGLLPSTAWGIRVALRGRRFLFTALGAAALGALLGSEGVDPYDPAMDLWRQFDEELLRFALPLVALGVVANGFAREVHDQTLLLHLVRPIARSTLYLSRWLSGTILAIPIAFVLLATSAIFSRVDMPAPFWTSLAITSALGVIATGAVLYLLASLFRHGAVTGLVYVFVIEPTFATVRGNVQRLSVSHHVRSLHHRLTDDLFTPLVREPSRIAPSQGSSVLSSVGESGGIDVLQAAAEVQYATTNTAVTTLVVLALAALALGALVVERREYPLKD
jgi:hypothetical protein